MHSYDVHPTKVPCSEALLKSVTGSFLSPSPLPPEYVDALALKKGRGRGNYGVLSEHLYRDIVNLLTEMSKLLKL